MSSQGSGYLPPPPPVSPFRTSFAINENNQQQQQQQPPKTAPPTMSSNEAKNPLSWDRSQIRDWLEGIKCGQYFKVFEDNHISGDILLECDQQALKAMGINKVGDRIRINQALKTLRQNNTQHKPKTLHQLNQESISPFVNHLSPPITHTNTNSPIDGYFSSKNRRQPSQRQPSSAPTSTSTNTGNGTKPQEAVQRPHENVMLSKQNTVRFIYGQGQSKNVNISGCYTSDQIKLRALKKINVDDISADNWCVHVADNELGTTARQLTNDELTNICHSQGHSERKRLMICVNGSSPSLKQLSKSQQILRESLSNSQEKHEEEDDDYDDDDEEALHTIFPETAPKLRERTASSLNRLSEQRPPSELISSNLAHYFPEVGTNELNTTLRNSIRFSKRMSRMSRFSKISNRASIASYLAPGILEEEDVPPVPQLPVEQPKEPEPEPVPEPEPEPEAEDEDDEEDEGTIRDESSLRRSILLRRNRSLHTATVTSDVDTLQSLKSKRQSIQVIQREELKGESGEVVDQEDDDDDEDEELQEEEIDEDEDSDEDDEGPTRWIKGRLIGSGSFGTVYLGMNSFTGELMAVKQVELPADSDEERAAKKASMIDALQREMDILRELQHENIVQYLGSNSEGNFLNIFLEYVPGGSVASMLANYGEFEEELIRNFVRQILHGLKYLHGQNIIHRDIKGANVLVDNKGCIKISDFGISKKIEAKLLTNRVSLQGSVYWMAPEVVKQTSYTLKADIWSLGCLVIEMFSGQHPFPEFSQMQAIFKLGQSQGPTVPPTCSDIATDFLKQTFAIDENERPTADELLKHDFMKLVVG